MREKEKVMLTILGKFTQLVRDKMLICTQVDDLLSHYTVSKIALLSPAFKITFLTLLQELK